MRTVVEALISICDEVGTPFSDAVKRHALNGEWLQLFQLKCDPRTYEHPESYWADAQCLDFLRKMDFDVAGVDRELKARQTFWECETQCCATNARLSRFMPDDPLIEDVQDERVLQFIIAMRKDISLCLGTLPSGLLARFGPGSTFSDKGFYTTIPDKMSSRPTVYPTARDLLPHWEDTAWFRALCKERPWYTNPEDVRTNRFTTVRKDALKYRGICIEASIPIFFQLGAGRELRHSLRKWGINLERGQQVHDQRARVASLTGDDATIDQSNASDTVARLLVKLALPDDWYMLLDSLRAPSTVIDGKVVRLEKFSSMGNGFTFELETLLFAAIARQVIRMEGGDPLSVTCYGDDLIVPSLYAKSVLAALRFFGFTPNEKKTYVDGPFRESCGGDYFKGVMVNTFKVQELPDEPQQRISIANGLRRVASDASGEVLPHRWRIVRRAWSIMLRSLPSDIRRCRGPRDLGDLVIHDFEDTWQVNVAKTLRARKNGTMETWLSCYSPISEVIDWRHFSPEVCYAAALYGADPRGVTPRGAIAGYKITQIAHVPFKGGSDDLFLRVTDKLALKYTRDGSTLRFVC